MRTILPTRPILAPAVATAIAALLCVASPTPAAAQQSTPSYGSQITTTYVLWSPPYERTASCTRLYQSPGELGTIGVRFFYHINEPITFRRSNVGTDSAGRIVYLYLDRTQRMTPGRAATTEVATLQWDVKGALVIARKALYVPRDTLGGQDQVMYQMLAEELDAARKYAESAMDLCRYRGQIPGRSTTGPRPD